MQKKYVLPILMVAPAIPAMQAIDFPAPEASDSQWKLSGVTAGSLTFTDGLISAPLGGTITTTVANLPKGNYKLAMLAGTNNATVSVNGKAIADGAFTLDKKGDIEITVVATDKSQAFAFGIEKIELVFDFAAAKEALGKQLEGIEVATPANPEKPHTEELKALAEELAKINADIAALDAETVETYEKYGFDSDNADYTANKIAEAIKAYAGSVKDFNDTVEPENEAYAIQLNNAAVIKTLTDGITSLKEEVAKSAEALKGVSENDLAARNNETLTTIGLDIKKLEDAVAALEDVETRLDPSKDGDASKTCTDTLAGLNEKAAELAASIASDKADDEAYREYTGVVITLTGAHSEAVTAIDAITDNEDYKGDDVFAGKKAEWKNSLSEIVAAAKDKAGIGTTIEGAAGKLETAKEAVAEAQEALTKVVEDANTFADGLNGEYATALEAVDALSTSLLDTTKDVNVPAKFKEGYDSKVKAIEDAIAAMSADINTHYAENDLTAATYADAQTEITDAIADLQQYIDNCAPVIAEQAKIDALNKALKEATEPVYPEDATDEEKAAIDASYSFAEDKFQQNIDHITEGIAKLQGELDKVTPENLADGVPNLDTNDLTEAIELLKDGVAKLADIYGKVGAFDKGFADELAKVDAYKDKLTRIEGNPNTWDKFVADDTLPYKALKAARDQFSKDYAAAQAENTTPEECYKLFTALDLNYDYAASCADAIAAYCKYVATGNLAVAEKQLEAVKAVRDELAEAGCPGAAEVDFTEIDATIATLTTEAEAVNNDETAEECTTNIKEAIEAIKGLQTEVNTFQADHKAYTDLQDSMTDTEGNNLFDTAIAAATTANTEISVAPATAHYEKVITDLQAEFDKLVADIDKAHKEDFSLTKPHATIEGKTNQQVFQAEIDRLIKAANDLPAAIKANHEALQAAITAGENTRVGVNELISSLEKYVTNEVGGEDHKDHNFTGDKAAAIEALTNILHDIDNLNAEAATAYGKGVAAEGNFTGKFEEKAQEATDIFTAFDKAYGENVAAHNKELKEAMWDDLANSLDGIHNSNIKAFETYKNLKHAAYKAKVEEVLITNEGLFNHAKAIRDLKEAFNTWYLTTITPAGEGETNDQYGPIAENNATLAQFIADANSLIDDMNAKAQTLKDAVAAVAQQYYNDNEPIVENAINDAKATMAGAGITAEEAVKAGTGLAEASHADAVKAYETATATPEEGVEPTDLGLAMDGIAQQLDDALNAINLQNAARLQWKSNSDEAAKTLDELTKQLDTFTYATEETKTAAKAAISDALTGKEALDNEAKANNDLIGSARGLVKYTEELNDLLAEAQAKFDAAKATHDNASENKALHEAYTKDNEDFQKQLEELRQYVSGFAGNYAPAVEGAETAVEKFRSEADRLAGDLSTNKDYIDNLKTTAQNTLDAAYNAVRKAEAAAIDTQLSRVKVAYNNAKANGEEVSGITPERLLEIENEIRSTMDLINGKEAAAEGDEAIKPLADLENAEFKTRALEIVETLDNLEAELDKAALDAARSALDTLAESVEAAIEAGKTALGECEESVQTGFAGKYDALGEKVDALRAQWQEGNDVLSQQGNLTRQLENIQKEVDSLKAEIAAADQVAKAEAEKVKVSQDKLAELTAEHEALQAALDALKERLEGFNRLEDNKNVLEYIQDALDEAKAKLDKVDHKDIQLTADSTLLDDSGIADMIDNIAFAETNSYFITKYNSEVAPGLTEIDLALAKIPADKRLTPSKKVEIKDKKAELTLAASNLAEAYNTSTDLTVAQLDEFIEEANRIISEIEALLGEEGVIATSTFKAGDVDEDDDVTVADAQSVLTWVGNQVSYADLLAESERRAVAADIDGNEALNIGDVTAIVNISLGYEPSQVRFAMRSRATAGTNHLFAELVSEENGVSRYAINLLNNSAFVAGQFDLTFAAGTIIKDITLGERASAHELHTFENNGSVRVIVASMENALISGSNGAVVYVDVANNGSVNVDEAIFADSDAHTYGVGGNGTSAIDMIRENLRDLKETIYNAAGQTLNRVQRGVNIIRKSDGTVTKELRK